MKNATNIALSAALSVSLLGGYSLFEYPSIFLLSFPLYFAFFALFSWVSIKLDLILNQMPLDIVMNQVQVVPTSHSIFLNHKNSII